MSGWVRESILSWYHRAAIGVLKGGPIPRHVAFIMDGNRRYAENHRISRAEGHSRGFDRLADMLQWCQDLGIREVTAYAFSIENFKRSPEEVATLLDLAREKFQGLLEDVQKLNERGICVRIIGNTELLPEDLQRIMARAVLATRSNGSIVLNLAFAYTSRDEIAHSIRIVAEGIAHGRLLKEDVDEELLGKCMYTKQSRSDPDLLVRTSGEVRLSDFLLWQSSATVLYFTKTMWPELDSVWHLIGAVFYYQRRHWLVGSIRNGLEEKKSDLLDCQKEERVRRFLEDLDCSDHDKLAKLANS